MSEITKPQWLAAQAAERKFHNEEFQTGFMHYGQSYAQYFKHLGIETDLRYKNIVEIGPADFPALAYCNNVGAASMIIEPMPSEYLYKFRILVCTTVAEDCYYKADEVWLFNVLQHVMDPHKIVERAKKQADVIRFFEPINYGIDECHLWNLATDMFKEWFGDCVQHYPGGQQVINFHTHECAYGVWRKAV